MEEICCLSKPYTDFAQLSDAWMKLVCPRRNQQGRLHLGWKSWEDSCCLRIQCVWIGVSVYSTLRRGLFRKSDTGISIWREFNSKFLMVVLMFSVYFHICVCVCMCVNFSRTTFRRNFVNLNDELVLSLQGTSLSHSLAQILPLKFSEKSSDSITCCYFHFIWKLTFLVSGLKVKF